jgi:hypothetical protein
MGTYLSQRAVPNKRTLGRAIIPNMPCTLGNQSQKEYFIEGKWHHKPTEGKKVIIRRQAYVKKLTRGSRQNQERKIVGHKCRAKQELIFLEGTHHTRRGEEEGGDFIMQLISKYVLQANVSAHV